MSEDRRRARVEWVAIGIAGAFLVLAITGLGFIAWHFSHYHAGWREAVPEAIQHFGWMPTMGAAWWIKIRVEDWLSGS